MSDQPKPIDSGRPDLEESTNVTVSHARIARDAAAVSREHRVREDGKESMPHSIIVIVGLVFFVAGGVFMSAKDNLFSYRSTIRPGYVREEAPGGGEAKLTPIAAVDAYSKKGQKIYSAKCNGCHGADAKGDGANYPSLVGSKWVLGSPERFSMVILNGLQGPTSSGKVYGAGVMPSQAAGMSAEDLAAVMTFLRNNNGNSTGDVVTVEMAKHAMEISAKRAKAGAPVTADELTAEHDKVLPGAALDGKSLVDPVSLEPAAE